MTPIRPVIRNIEGDPEYDVHFAWASQTLRPGLSAVLRVHNEVRSLPWVLSPLLRAVDEVVLVDNRSTDGTAELAREIVASAGALERFQLHSYPHVLSRCGDEHLATPADSLHSLTFFNNFAFSHARCRYMLKWDGDQVLTERGIATLRDLSWMLGSTKSVVSLALNPMFIASDREAFLDLTPYQEPNVRPNGPGFHFGKAFEWEYGRFGDADRWSIRDSLSIELKHVDADEFSHWTDLDFDKTPRTSRKGREVAAMQAISRGATPDGFERIVGPDDVHIVDHAVRVVVPRLQATGLLQSASPPPPSTEDRWLVLQERARHSALTVQPDKADGVE